MTTGLAVEVRRVGAAALRVNGSVFTGFCHSDAFDNAFPLERYSLDEQRVWRLSDEIEHGFVDQFGVFMDRDEADIVARAAGQYDDDTDDDAALNGLASENLRLDYQGETIEFEYEDGGEVTI